MSVSIGNVKTLRHFRPPPLWSRWELRSSGLLRSE